MKKFSRAISSRLMSWTVSAVIIGSLCFSVGEGLRLSPFPVSSLSENVNATEKTSLSQYGPLNVPAQPQKRSKRQAVDLACPESSGDRKPVISFSYLLENDPVDAGSLLFVPRSPGRAPPFLS
jgi:hypothetical protein